MDLGIAGKQALVCAASKGLGRGCALALAKEGVHVTIVARGREALEATAAELGESQPPGHGDPVRRCRHHHAGGARGGAGRLPAAGHPGEQRRRAAAGRFPQLVARGLDRRAGRQHADADRTHQGDGGWHDRAPLRPHQ
ncbi:MAG: SDR family NAD(P)-dependent oxidoreductase [Rhodocyclaceae bacterium]|nr:SDR family NAD(P)-dependent oxidoreductase [Rhodocyclaceae bacterium]